MVDFLIVGAGLYGATFAHLAKRDGFSVRIIEKRNHIAGNVYTERRDGIDVHMYGPHIFHTNDDEIWEFVNRFATFEQFQLNIKVWSDERAKMFSLPFNLNTFYELVGVTTPEQAKKFLESDRPNYSGPPRDLEEQAISLVGRTVYETLIRDYTTKQWCARPKDLPASIIKRLPVRFTYDNNYFNDKYQGIPVGGYTNLVSNMIESVDVELGVDFLKDRQSFIDSARTVVYTGPIDALHDHKYGELAYRSLDFVHEKLDVESFQGTAIVNYPSLKRPYTRITEHKHFLRSLPTMNHTWITYEHPCAFTRSSEPMYPINDEVNQALFRKYQKETPTNMIVGGRLGEYRYYDMHQVIGSAMSAYRKLVSW